MDVCYGRQRRVAWPVRCHGNTLAVVVPENTVSKERSGQIKFISVSDPTLVETVTLIQDASPEAPKPQAPKADLLDVVFTLTVRPKTFRR